MYITSKIHNNISFRHDDGSALFDGSDEFITSINLARGATCGCGDADRD
jgi:hypothetical protein